MDIKEQVRDFYDQVGWQDLGEGVYQNARYEDLRPVSHEYIHRCHLRVLRHLRPSGKYLLDAGSGPVQYPEYLEYSRRYAYRVCADISIVALQEARKRIGGKGLFVVADIANLPFKNDVFEGEVSLHTIHHLPLDEHTRAYTELYRVLAPDSQAVVVNGWDSPPLTRLTDLLCKWVEAIYGSKLRSSGKIETSKESLSNSGNGSSPKPVRPEGTYVRKHNAAWLKHEIGRRMPVEIWVWRTVNTRFLRTFIHTRLGGATFLRALFWIEERFPHFLGSNGQYPLIVIRKCARAEAQPLQR